jgi:hypothetical protein
VARLSQIIAVEKGAKVKAETDLTAAHRKLGNNGLLSGISRTYVPKDDEGEQLPPERTLVQVNVETVFSEVSQSLVRLFDITATKEYANCTAKSDVIVDGETVLRDVPVTYLLFLEKQLINVVTFVRKLPTLDPSETWSYDPALGVFRTEPVQTNRNKKVLRNHVRSEATKEHPAQVDVYQEDVPMGQWHTVKFSGAAPASRVSSLIHRVEQLQAAVKCAREEANSTTVQDVKYGEAVFGFLFNH